MPRPKTKKELIQLSNANYHKLIEFVNSLSEDQINADLPPNFLNRNIKDVLAHLHHWHLLLLGWYETGMKGEKPQMPAEGYTWKTLPAFNKVVNTLYKNEEIAVVFKLLDSSFNQIQNLIERHSEEELFTKKYYKWTGTTSLAAYLISATSSHYDWAYKLIKKCI